MPIINGDPAVCWHGGVHGVWTSRNQKVAICNLAKPHLRNIIRMLADRINHAYPIVGYTDRRGYEAWQALQLDEALLTSLQAELERRET